MQGFYCFIFWAFSISSWKTLVEEGNESNTMIVGEGIAVDIYEYKFGERKCNCWHRIEGIWILGGIGSSPEGKLFQ